MIKATIITIGEEMLIGQIVDTNSVSIAKHLNRAGITVVEKLSIGDDAPKIEQTLARAHAQSEVVIITGGLGPTKDDITKHTLARIFHSSMHEDEAVAEHVRTMLEKRGIKFNELNRSQALVPDCCTVLFNHHGTAPGMWFEDKDGGVTVSLPGVPFEMEHLMEDEVMPRLKNHFSLHANVHRTMITSGLPESMLAERIEKWEDALPEGVKLAYLPAPNVVRLRLSAYDQEDGEATRARIDELFKQLYDIIPDHIVGYEDASIQALIHDLLIERGQTLAVAESCTGGEIASRFTAMAGASAYFLCGVVAYANEAKEQHLGVLHSTLEQYGAVSQQTAEEMARGARERFEADYAVATTGIAGPDGGTLEKPVGTVWIAVADEQGVEAHCFSFGDGRERVVRRASYQALRWLQMKLLT